MNMVSHGLRHDIVSGLQTILPTPIFSPGHFIYGILDFLQQLSRLFISNRILTSQVFEVVLNIAKNSKPANLRWKAFEVLATVGGDSGIQRVTNMLPQTLDRASQRGAQCQWKAVQAHVTKMHKYVSQHSPDQQVRDPAPLTEPSDHTTVFPESLMTITDNGTPSAGDERWPRHPRQHCQPSSRSNTTISDSERNANTQVLIVREVEDSYRLKDTGPDFADIAISPSCDKIALINETEFSILEIAYDEKLKCFALQFQEICRGPANANRPMRFVVGAMSDERLCLVVSQPPKSRLAVYDTRTCEMQGKMKTLSKHSTCHNIVMSSKGDILALALRDGTVDIYPSGLCGKFNEGRIRVPTTQARQEVKCMAISPDSSLISICSSDNTICTYRIDVQEKSVTFGRKCNPALSSSRRSWGNPFRREFRGVTCMT
jgi:WD40 repeat protein